MIRMAKLLTPETKTQHVWRSHKIINPTSLVKQHQQHSHHCRTHMLTQMEKTVNTSLTSSFNSSRARNTLRRSSTRCGNFSSTYNKQTQQQNYYPARPYLTAHPIPHSPPPQTKTGQPPFWQLKTGSTLQWTTSLNCHQSLRNSCKRDSMPGTTVIISQPSHHSPRPRQRKSRKTKGPSQCTSR